MGLFRRIERNNNARKYYKAIDESSGLKKVHLMVRNKGAELILGLPNNYNDASLSLIAMEIMSAQMLFADIFYTTLNDSFEKVGGSPDEMFSDLANELKLHYDKQTLITSRLFGVALAIFIRKAADISDSTVNKKEVTKYIESGKVKDEFKSELKNSFLCTMKYYDDPMTGARTDGAMASRDMGVLSYSLVDMKLGKGHYADPMYMMAATTAEALTYRETTISESDVDKLKKSHFLK